MPIVVITTVATAIVTTVVNRPLKFGWLCLEYQPPNFIGDLEGQELT